MDPIGPVFSKNANAMKKSVIRELLKLTQQPDIISFAGGLPDPATFPVPDLRAAAERVFAKNPAKALQYGTTEGDPTLKTELLKYEKAHGIVAETSEILITSASQQALDMIPKLFLDPGDSALCGKADLYRRYPGDPIVSGEGDRNPLQRRARWIRYGRA